MSERAVPSSGRSLARRKVSAMALIKGRITGLSASSAVG
jgi:hypothetical protein